MPPRVHPALVALLLLGLAGCSSSPERARDADGPPSGGVPDLADAVVRDEPRSRYGNPPSYVVFGRRYYTMKSAEGYRERGIASWYGTKFHGRRTSSGERYDMYRMTAAHKALPLPTYVEVRNLQNGRTAVLRVNDRGPFHDGRVIDLSYAAALKLDILRTGTGLVEVRALAPGERRGPLPRPDTREPLPGPAPLEAQDGLPPGAVLVEAPAERSTATMAVANPSPDASPGQFADSTDSTDSIDSIDSIDAIDAIDAIDSADSADSTYSIARTASASAPMGDLRLWVQLGAFRDATNAHELARRVESALGVAPRVQDHVTADGVTVRRVRIGPLASVDAVDALLARLRAGVGMPQGRVVIEP